MPNVVNVRFRNRGKSYYFDPGELTVQTGDSLVVETSKGLELGECVEGCHEVPEEGVVQPLKSVVRIATEEDLRIAESNRRKEKSAFGLCEERIKAHGLDMKLVDVEYSFEGNKILFFFTSDGRVDFRELVKDLASLFHTRIELRQIGVRDGAKLLGGLGICGRPFCCSTFLEEFQPVSIRMAKTQNLSLNPTKISGTCGRLMCCLKYEQDAYEHLIKTMPKVDAPVDTPKGKGNVAEVNLLRRTVKVRLADSADTGLQSYPLDRLGYTLNGEYIEPKPEEKAPVASDLPDLSRYMSEGADSLGSRLAEAMEGRSGEKRSGRNRRKKNRGGQKERSAEGPQEQRSEKTEKTERPEKPERKEKKPEHTERKFDRKPENRQQNPPKNREKHPVSSVKAQAAAEKAEGGEKKANYHRRYFHRGSKKPGGEKKHEGQ
jgi:cell fate regulator YaaT (PSP1 superfamily)